MGEWPEYFEDFPEENPANWIDGRFDPQAAAAARKLQETARTRLAREQAQLAAEIRRIIKKHSGKQTHERTTSSSEYSVADGQSDQQDC